MDDEDEEEDEDDEDEEEEAEDDTVKVSEQTMGMFACVLLRVLCMYAVLAGAGALST